MEPRTKHLNMRYHHFREAVADERIHIKYVPTTKQLADMMIKVVIIMSL
jgi:hypothetical protein